MTQGLQNASLDHAAMEKLAAQVVRDFTTFCAKLKDMQPQVAAIQQWFRAHPRGATSLSGCASFKEFCEKRLRRDESTVYRMLGVNSTAVREAKRADARRKLLEEHTNADFPTVDIRHCAMQELLAELRDVALICSDPPYAATAPYGELAQLAATALAPGGILAVMVGHAHLPIVLEQMRQHLPFRWVTSYLLPGQSARIFSERINVGWKPIVLFGGVQERWMSDVVRSDRPDKRFHDWGQSVSGMAQLIESLSSPGDLVCDPFCGGGTTLVAAATLGR